MSHQLWTNLIKYNISPNLLYYLDCLRHKIKPTNIINADKERKEAQDRELINNNGDLTLTAMVVLNDFETLLVKTKKKITTEVLGEGFLDNIKIYREIFPAGILPHGEVARQSIEELKLKFVWFFKTFPEFEWPLIHEATNYYVFLKRRDNYKFMANSSYFIQKTDPKTKTVKSTLSDYCQLLKDDPDIIHRELVLNS